VGRVAYSEEPEYELLGGVVGTPIVDEITATTDHSITLTNLKTDHQYRYYIGTAFVSANPSQPTLILEKSPDHFFRTPPAPGVKKTTKLWVLGDFGFFPSSSVNNRQDSTIAAMRDFMATNKTGPMDLWLWLGDNAYEQGLDVEYQNYIFDKGRARYDWIFRTTPFFATPGNHDYYDGSLSVPHRDSVRRVARDAHYFSVVDNFKNGEGGGEPSGTEAYYSFEYSNIHFISLDTYGFEKKGDTSVDILHPVNSQQYKWLERDLIKTQANSAINWIIVYTHMPPYSGGTHDSDVATDLAAVRQNLIPLLDKYKVDMVLAGHSHDYQRSRLMKGHTGVSNTFVSNVHTPAVGSNAQGSGRYDGSPNSCFYYKTTSAKDNEGIIYVVNGGGGRPYEPGEGQDTKNPALISKLMQVHNPNGGSMYLEIESKRLTAKFIGANKKVLDQFVIYKDLDNFTVPRTDSISRTATCECTEALNENTSFTHYTDNNANLLLSINKHNINIGKVGVAPFEVKLSGAGGRTNVGAFFPDNYVRADRTRTFSSNWRVMNRYWSVKPATELTGSQQVTIRHYYKQEDWLSLFYGATNDDLVYRDYLKFYKINSLNTAYVLDPKSGSHRSLPGATAFNKNGIWVYDKSDDPSARQGSPHHWRGGYNGPVYPPNLSYLQSDTQYGEFVVGRLAGGGGIGGQAYNLNPRGTKTLISSGDRWRYFSKGIAPSDYVYQLSGVNEVLSWKGGNQIIDYFNNFTDWYEGNAPFGYSPNGEDLERRIIPGCQAELNCYVVDANEGYFAPGCLTAPCANRWTTYYFRKTILAPQLANPVYQSILINYRRDDGVIIYVNGKEIIPRDAGMPSGTITNETFASNASLEYQWHTVVIPNDGTYFRKTPFNATNTVAVELHQNSLTSSDTQFDMEIVLSQDLLTSPTRISAIEDDLNNEPMIALYPNPTENGKVYFTTPVPFETARIMDVRGVVLRYLAEPGTLTELDVSALPTGTFFLISHYQKTAKHFKIIKK
jgi:hypothetical protein